MARNFFLLFAFSFFCIFYSLNFYWQFLLSNGFILLLVILMNFNTSKFWLIFILFLFYDLYVFSFLGLHFIIFILCYFVYIKILGLFQEQNWYTCSVSFSLVYLLLFALNIEFYFNIWGWLPTLYNIIINISIHV